MSRRLSRPSWTHRNRWWVAAVAAVLATVVGCSAPTVGGTTAPGAVIESSDRPARGAPSALADRFDDRLPTPLVDPDHVLSGGPPPDGIPAIDSPTFQRADRVSWLDAQEGVLSLTVGGETRAYPLRVMTWHEIVNDTVRGVPVAVTYCPLCASGVAFERTVEDRVLSFGTSGMLYADNLVMYDRQTESLWPQLTGQASLGELTGSRLTAIPMGTVAWQEFRKAHPAALVLSQDTGFGRPYGVNPYVGYDDPSGELLFALPTDADRRLPVKERVIGLGEVGTAVAVRRMALVGAGPVEVTVGGQDLVLWHRPGQVSALDAGTVAGGADLGTVAVFAPVTDGRRLRLVEVEDERGRRVEDAETGSSWNVLGRAVSGPLAGARLQPVTFLDTFWFAWAAFHPATELLLDADLA
ncbi:MAG: DUF3179 domain-containing protein [Nocardioidaceae bacterium]